jgi:serpin B
VHVVEKEWALTHIPSVIPKSSVLAILILSTLSLQFVGFKSVLAQQQSDDVPITVGYPVKLAIGQVASFDSADLRFRFANITEDSRCPSEVQCIWEGQVIVSLEAIRQGQNIGNFSLALGPDGELSSTNFEGYLVRLVRVEPYPVSTEPIHSADYVATLIIQDENNTISGIIRSSAPIAIDATGRPTQTVSIGDKIAISAAIQSGFDDDRSYVAIVEARSSNDGITRFIGISNGTVAAKGWITLESPWNPEEPGVYEFRIFLLDGFVNPHVLSAVVNSNITVTERLKGEETTVSRGVIDGNNMFALDFYSKVSAGSDLSDNIFYSPWSISTAFALVHEGARGETAGEIQSLFHFPDNDLKRQSFASILKDLSSDQGNHTLKTANALWIMDGYMLLDDYLRIAREFYGSEVSNVDFPSEAARQQINEWVESRTNHKILNLIPEGTLTSDTRLVITNAVYFKGNWTTQFDKEVTRDAEFKVSQDTSVVMPMMSLREKEFKYAETDKLQILELPYQGNKVSMLILLPKDYEGLQDLEEALTLEDLEAWKAKLRNQTINVTIPKFKLETMYGLNTILSEMGMPTAFDPDLADLSGITAEEELFIQAALHKAFVEVNEEGTEAAGATGAVVGTTSLREYPVFNADHPFIFIIQDAETDNILFMGRVANPATQ